MKHLRFIVLSFCVFSLSACKTLEGIKQDWNDIDWPSLNAPSFSQDRPEQLLSQGGCPKAFVVEDLGLYEEFSDPVNKNAQTLIARSTINILKNRCSYQEKSVVVELKLAFDGTLGPQGRVEGARLSIISHPFFVAVTSASGKILAKEVFSAPIEYETQEERKFHYEDLRQVIPIPDRATGAKYKILVGFQLEPEQLERNRYLAAAKKEQSELDSKVSVKKSESILREPSSKKPVKKAPVIYKDPDNPSAPGTPVDMSPSPG